MQKLYKKKPVLFWLPAHTKQASKNILFYTFDNILFVLIIKKASKEKYRTCCVAKKRCLNIHLFSIAWYINNINKRKKARNKMQHRQGGLLKWKIIEYAKKHCEYAEPWHKQEKKFFVVNRNSVEKMLG